MSLTVLSTNRPNWWSRTKTSVKIYIRRRQQPGYWLRGVERQHFKYLHQGKNCKKGARIKEQIIAEVRHYFCTGCSLTHVREFTQDEIKAMRLIRHQINCGGYLPPRYGILPATGRRCLECRNCGKKATIDPFTELILREDQQSTI